MRKNPSLIVMVALMSFPSTILAKDYGSDKHFRKEVQRIDSLTKYSYLCYSKIPGSGRKQTGTCFFYRSQSAIYLVSAFHFFKKFTTKIGDSFLKEVEVLDHQGQPVTSFQIHLSDTSKTNFYSEIDLYAFQVNQDISPNYINDLIDESNTKHIPSIIHSCGYLSIKQFTTDRPIISHITSSYFPPSQRNIVGDGKTSKENIAQIKFVKDSYFFFSTLKKGSGGFSGAPIFGKIKNKYKFIGVIIAEELGDGLAINLKKTLAFLSNLY